jgi:hypothetical protein
MTDTAQQNEWEIGQLGEPHACKAGDAYHWLKRAYAIFKCQKASWVGVAFFTCMMVGLISAAFQSAGSELIKTAGGFVVLLLLQILLAGVMVAAHRCEQDQRFDITCIFSGFGKPLILLLVFGAIYFMASWTAEYLRQMLLNIYGSADLIKLINATDFNEVQQLLADPVIKNDFTVYLTLWMTVIFSLAMLVGFAPALIIFHQVPPLTAIKLSMSGVIRNILPLSVFGLLLIGISFGLTIVAIIANVILAMIVGKQMILLLATLLMLLIVIGLLAIIWLATYVAFSEIFWLRHNEIAA